MTTDEARQALDAALRGHRVTKPQRRHLAEQLRAITGALPAGSGPMSVLSGDLVAAAQVLDER
jgi:hypothetical protein